MFEFGFNPYIKLANIKNIKKIIYENGIKESINAGQIIIYPYEYVEYFYFIASGLTQIVTSDDNGKELVFGILGEGACYGPSEIFLNSTPEEYYLKAIHPCEVYKIPKDIFFNLINSSEVFREYLFINFSLAIKTLLTSISNKSLFPCSKMLYDFFVYSVKINSNCDHLWFKLDYNYNQNQLSDILGVSISTLQRAIYSLRDEGKIRITNNEFEVKIPEEAQKQFFDQNN